MKNLLKVSVIALLSINVVFGQEIEFLKLTPNGVNPIIVEVAGISAAELYQKSINWVQETYKTPSSVLKANIENDLIRIDGFAFNAWWFSTVGIIMYMDMDYTIKIDFKDGRYRFEFIIGQFYKDGQRAMYDYTMFFNKKGYVKKAYSDAVPSIEVTMNDLSVSFYNYVSGKTREKNDDW
jgi:hypothetical protein